MTVPTDTSPPVPGCLVITDDPSSATSAMGKPGMLEAGDLGEEGVVAAGGLGAALDDVPGHHRAGQPVPVGPAASRGARPPDPPPARRR